MHTCSDTVPSYVENACHSTLPKGFVAKPQEPAKPKSYAVDSIEMVAKCRIKEVEIRNKYPHMKPARIARKVAEFFNLKEAK